MKRPLAVIAITKHGARRVVDLVSKMPDADSYISPKFKDDVAAICSEGALSVTPVFYEETLKDLIARIFNEYATLVFFVSLGAVVRLIAPVLKDKKTDPAVLVVDDAGKFVISVLSGHLGGANEMAEIIADKLGAAPIVTTASDVGKTVPVDLVGRKFGWTIDDFSTVTAVSAAVVNEEPVAFIRKTGEKNWWMRSTPLPANIHVLESVQSMSDRTISAVLLVTDTMNIPKELGNLAGRTVVYRPKSLCLGMGCDSGVTVEELERLVAATLEANDLSIKSVRKIATVDLKETEPGLVAFIQKYAFEFESFTRDELNGLRDRVVTPSPYAEKYLNVVGVAEPAALLAAEHALPDGGPADLVVPKVKGSRCTLAVARIAF